MGRHIAASSAPGKSNSPVCIAVYPSKRCTNTGTMKTELNNPKPRIKVRTAQIASVLAAHAEKVAQYKAGKTGLFGFLVGQVMKASPGADAADVNAKLREVLGVS